MLRVLRLNLADGEPFALVTVWLPANLGAHVSRADVERATFYDLLPLHGVETGRVVQTITAIAADRPQAAASALPSASPCWRVGGSPTIDPATRSWSPNIATPPSRPRSKSSFPPLIPLEFPMAETVGPTTPIELVRAAYERFPERTAIARRRLGRALTFAEKVLIAHADDPETIGLDRGVDYGDYRPDRVAMQDATAQMALLQFTLAKLPSVAVPSTVHCDHLIQARVGADADMRNALDVNSEVYEFLRTVSAKYGIGFWKPGSGIIHQVVLEQVRVPRRDDDRHRQPHAERGRARHGRDRRRWRRRGRRDGRLAVQHPRPQAHRREAHRRALRLGRAQGRDPQGRGHPHGQGRHRRDRRVLRPGRRVDLGHRQGHHLQHGRGDRRHLFALPLRRRDGELPEVRPAARRSADLADEYAEHLRNDPEVDANPEQFYDRVIEIDLSELEPHLVGPHTPDLDRPISEVRAAVEAEGYPAEISAALVGSCTNSSYEDIGRAAHVARQASAAGCGSRRRCSSRPAPSRCAPRSNATVCSPTSKRSARPCSPTRAVRASVSGNATTSSRATTNTIVSSFNRNFPARNDGNPSTLSFIGSPETVTAMALTGRLDVDFVREPVTATTALSVQLIAPSRRRAAGEGVRPGRVGLRRSRRGSGEAWRSWSRRAASGWSCSSRSPVGRRGLHRAAGADEGRGQVHHRPHLARGPVAEVPRSPHQHLRQPVHRREQRVHAGRVGRGDRRS